MVDGRHALPWLFLILALYFPLSLSQMDTAAWWEQESATLLFARLDLWKWTDEKNRRMYGWDEFSISFMFIAWADARARESGRERVSMMMN